MPDYKWRIRVANVIAHFVAFVVVDLPLVGLALLWAHWQDLGVGRTVGMIVSVILFVYSSRGTRLDERNLICYASPDSDREGNENGIAADQHRDSGNGDV